MSNRGCRQPNDQIHVVRLNLGFMRRFVAHLGTAFLASVIDDIAALWIGIDVIGAQDAAAAIRAVAGKDIHMQGAEAEGAVIARGVT